MEPAYCDLYLELSFQAAMLQMPWAAPLQELVPEAFGCI